MNDFTLQGSAPFLLLSAGLFVLMVIAAVIKRTLAPKTTYTKRRYLMTKSELVFDRALFRACQGQYVIYSKVRIADVLIQPAMNNKKEWWRLFAQISSKHVDFVLCAPRDMSIVCCIELDDVSHRKPDRR